MKKRLILATAVIASLSTLSFAKPNMQKDPEALKKLSQIAGESSPYYRANKEVFPKDYFLVSQNLPFLVGVALFHPNSDTLNLTKEQLQKLADMKKNIVPKSIKLAKEIKGLELELAKNIIDENKDPKTQEELVKKIAELKTKLTMGHINCIHTVKNLLSKEQFEKLLKLASKKAK